MENPISGHYWVLWTPAEEEERVGVDGELLRRMQDGTTQTDRKRHRGLIKGEEQQLRRLQENGI